MSTLFFSYIPGNSLLHRLDPRTKIIAIMLSSILIFRAVSFSEMFGIGVIFLILLSVSSIPIKTVFDSIRPMRIILLFIFIIHLFFTEGTSLMYVLGLNITHEGLLQGMIVTLRFVYLLLFASLLTASTAASLITVGIERLLRPFPLKALGISSFDLATMMSMSLYFVPMLYGSFNDLKDAQLSRGMDMRKNPIKAVYSLAVPMTRIAFRMADDLAVSMESRCYQGVHRTSIFDMSFGMVDLVSLLVFGILFSVVFIISNYFLSNTSIYEHMLIYL